DMLTLRVGDFHVFLDANLLEHKFPFVLRCLHPVNGPSEGSVHASSKLRHGRTGPRILGVQPDLAFTR
ncbi:MAG: hypothetical protein VX719_02320, partial [Pseudomonadota bacterium]|nr:hypothetical protein [Pseudomonadota bacterium]